MSIEEEDVILILERTPLTEALIRDIICEDTKFEVLLKNDLYSSLQLYPKSSAGGKLLAFMEILLIYFFSFIPKH